MEATVDITKLSASERRALLAQLAAEDKAAKEKAKSDKAAYKELSLEFLAKHIDGLVDRQASMEKLVQDLFTDYSPVLDFKSEIFGEDVRDQESHTITAPDGKCSITIGYNVNIIFDGTENAGITKIKNFLTNLQSDDEVAVKLHKAVNVLLRPNKKTGMLNPASIIQLNAMRDEFNSDEFNQGLDIIINAQGRAKSSMYVSGYKFVDVGNGHQKKMEFRFTI